MFIRFPVDRPSEVLNRQAGGSIGWLDNSFAHFILKIRVNPFTLEITRLKKGKWSNSTSVAANGHDPGSQMGSIFCLHCTLYIYASR